MNLYKFHTKPETLLHHDIAHEKVPDLVWKKYKNNPAELKKREGILAKDTESAYWYANDVLKGRFPAGEAAIAKDAEFAYMYARFVLKGRFPEGEAVLAKDAYQAYQYANNVLKGPFPAAEEAIAKDTWYAYYYANEVLKGPFPAGEAAIAKDAKCAYYYANNVLKGRFPAGEAAIAKDAKISSKYADEFYADKKVSSLESYSLTERGLIYAWDSLLYINGSENLPAGGGDLGLLQQDMRKLLSLVSDDDEDEIMEFIEWVDEGCRHSGVPALTKSILNKIFTEAANKSKITKNLTIYISDDIDVDSGWVSGRLVDGHGTSEYILNSGTPVIFMNSVDGTDKNGVIIHTSNLT